MENKDKLATQRSQLLETKVEKIKITKEKEKKKGMYPTLRNTKQTLQW